MELITELIGLIKFNCTKLKRTASESEIEFKIK